MLTDRSLFPNPAPTQLAIMPQSPEVVGENYSQRPTETPHNTPSGITSGAPFPHALQKMASGPRAFPGLGPVANLLAPDREGVSPSCWENRGQWRVHPKIRSGVACSSQMPLSLPAELELNHRSALLEPCAVAACCAAAARRPPLPPAPRHAAPEQTMTGRASRDSAWRTALRPPLPPLPPPPPPQPPQPPLCLRKRTQHESPRSLPTARSPRPPPHLWPITELEVFPPPP